MNATIRQTSINLSDMKNFKTTFDLDCFKTPITSKNSLFSEMKQVYSEKQLKQIISQNTPKRFSYTPNSFSTAIKQNSFEKALNSPVTLNHLKTPQAELSAFSPNRCFNSSGMPLNLKGSFSKEARNNMKIGSFVKNRVLKEKEELVRGSSLKANSRNVVEKIRGMESVKNQGEEVAFTSIKILKIVNINKREKLLKKR